MKRKVVSLVTGLVLLVTGCGAGTGEEIQTQEIELPQEISWEINYEVPTSSVNVLVDREGYLTDRDKVVCFRGEDLGTTFQVVDAESDEVVYTGTIEDKVFDEASGEYVSQGNFTEFTTEGTYYIETDIIGRSYKFEIKSDVYDTLFDKMLMNSLFFSIDASMMEEIEDGILSLEEYQAQSSKKDVFDESMTIQAQALSMQYYPLCYETENSQNTEGHSALQDICEEAEWLLQMQEQDGSVYAGLYMEDGTQRALRAPVSRDATAAFCGSMVSCARLFENVDVALSDKYLKAAKKAWKYLDNTTTTEDSAIFHANAYLLWETGEKQYLTETTKYLANHTISITGDRLALYGALAYVSAEAKTDTDICAALMKSFMEVSEDTAAAVKNQPYQVFDRDMQQCYERMLIVAIANYVVPNNEYVRVMENNIHYLLGRNNNGYRYITEDGVVSATTDTIGKAEEWDAIARLMLSGILQVQKEE